jgi:hydrogenase expression/formation protein HypC
LGNFKIVVMCLSFPARVVSVEGQIAFVDYGNGAIEPVIVNGFDDVKEGDPVVVSYGMIMEKITEEEYAEMLRYQQELMRALQDV